VLTLSLFLFLLIATRQNLEVALPVNLYFRLDPLTGITAMLASRSWLAPMALGIATLLLALVFGRVWCGWLCPLGTVLDWTPSYRANAIPGNWRLVKYGVLVTIVIAALWQSLTLLILDPITLLGRTVAGVIIPGLNVAVTAAEGWLYGFTPLQPSVEWFDRFARSSLLTDQPFFLPNLWILAVFVGVLALNAIRPRFWCCYLCPLGALLGLLARISLIRHRVDTLKCVACQRCADVCHTAAIHPDRRFAASPGECTTCLDCVEVCPTGAIAFTRQLRPAPVFDLSRREFLTIGAVATVGAALLPVIPSAERRKPTLVRPPGATTASMLNQCVRCGECVKVCPTGGLQPSLSWGDWSGLWTPRLAARLGYCDYSCNSCGQVCPTGAIPELPLEEKRRTVIGIARIDEKRCIPFAENRDCLVCEEMCPVSDKAIKLEAESVVNSSGQLITVRRPAVINDQCIGCGICETKCPVEGESAIIIHPAKRTD
jgi:ferredoxin